MNQLQSIQFDMLKEFISICDDLNLTYYLVCGSCLGTVKYKGFIPWDDDLDVALPRADYDVFIERAQSMLPNYIFLQNCHTDEKYPLYFCKLRNNNTTFIENVFRYIPMNHGVYIDIFPLDGYPKDNTTILEFEREKVLFNRRRSVRYYYNRFSKQNIRHPKAIVIYLMYKIFGYCSNTQKTIEKFEQVTAKFDCQTSDLWCNHGNWQGKLEYAPREQYGNGTWATFEGLKVRIPENYDAYLSQKYGNWRADLPDDQKVPSHGHLVDLSRPYTDYIVKLKNGKIRLKTSEELLSSGITPPEGYKY